MKIKPVLAAGLSILSICVLSLAASSSDAPLDSNSVVLEIDGTKVTLSDFDRQRPTALFQARNAFYEAEKKAVDQYIDDYLLERQAKKENLTVTQLLDRHVNSTIAKDPPEEALRVYYEGVDTKEPFEAVRGQILQHVRDRRIEKAKSAYIQSLRAQASVALKLTPPRADVTAGAAPIRGSVDAPVKIIEYADYECPYCQQIQPVLNRVEADFKGKIAFAYKDVPLPMHSHAEKAAEAAHCAGEQGKYWEYHDLLFASKTLEVAQLKEHARQLKLDGAAFDKCLDSGAEADVIKPFVTEAKGVGLQGTPSFFINGRYFSGGMSYEQFRSVIEEELGASAKLKETAGLNP